MRRFRALIKKEITHMIRDPRTLIFIFIMPILQLVLLGYANNTDIKNVSTVIFNQDNGQASRELLNSFQATGYFSFDYSAFGQSEVDRLIASGKARVGIVIPPDYSAKLAAGEVSSVLVLIDGSDPTVAQYVLSAAQLAGQAHGVSVRAQQLALSGLQLSEAASGPVDVRTRVLYNPDLQGSYNIVPGLIAIILFQTATSLTALAIVRERERGTIEQLIVTPIRSWELVIGKILPYVILAFFDTLEVILLGRIFFGVPVRGSLMLVLALSGLLLLSGLGIGLLASTIAHTQQEAQLLVYTSLLPSIFLSGFFFPIEAMPPVLRWASYVIPLRYYLVIIRALLIKGVGASALLAQIYPLALFGILIMGFAAARFRKRLD